MSETKTAAAPASQIASVGKLTAKGIGVNPKKIAALPDSENRLLICTIGGFVSGIQTKEDARSGKVYYPLVGQFEGINPETGKRTRSGVCYLPEGPHEMVVADVQARATVGRLPMRIKFEVYAVKSNAPLGYGWECLDMLPPEETRDALADLMGSVPALPAPPVPAALPAPAEASGQDVPDHATEEATHDETARSGSRRGKGAH